MAKVKSKNTKPEITVRKFLFSKGLRYRIHDKKLPGHPDIVLKKYNTIILINGCFWHGHQDVSCRFSRLPKSNVIFWQEKINKNIKKDSINNLLLKDLKWNVITIWECQLKDKKSIELTLDNLYKELLEIKKLIYRSADF